MVRMKALHVAAVALLYAIASPGAADDRDGGVFLVRERGYALLNRDGQEVQRLETITNAAGALSPDGRWVAFSKSEPNSPPGKARGGLVIQSRVDREKRKTVPLVWGTTGSSFLPIWSSDSSRILICEQGWNDNRSRESAYRLYDLGKENLTQLTVPSECWVNDWSADGKRLLTTAQSDNGTSRIAWVNTDGTGSIEYITSEDEIAYLARLSPDGRKILCMIGPKVPKEQRSAVRLSVIDLSTNKRTTVDEPGETHGYCWSADGAKIAYTWQRSLDKPAEVDERETNLITCNADGSNRTIVTTRKYEVPPNSSGRSGVIFFFDVLDWQ
jgi:Tol biopolymer transport system component